MGIVDIRELIDSKRRRLDLYIKKESEILDGGVQAYGIGTRSVSRYNAALSEIRAAIKELEKEIEDLEAQLNGGRARKSVGVVLRDW